MVTGVLDLSAPLQDLFGLLDGRQTFVIGKDGIVKLVFNNQARAEHRVSMSSGRHACLRCPKAGQRR